MQLGYALAVAGASLWDPPQSVSQGSFSQLGATGGGGPPPPLDHPPPPPPKRRGQSFLRTSGQLFFVRLSPNERMPDADSESVQSQSSETAAVRAPIPCDHVRAPHNGKPAPRAGESIRRTARKSTTRRLQPKRGCHNAAFQVLQVRGSTDHMKKRCGENRPRSSCCSPIFSPLHLCHTSSSCPMVPMQTSMPWETDIIPPPPPLYKLRPWQWEELGLEELSSGEGEASDSGHSFTTGSLFGERDSSGTSTSSGSQGWADSEDYSTDVSDNPRKRGRKAERA